MIVLAAASISAEPDRSALAGGPWLRPAAVGAMWNQLPGDEGDEEDTTDVTVDTPFPLPETAPAVPDSLAVPRVTPPVPATTTLPDSALPRSPVAPAATAAVPAPKEKHGIWGLHPAAVVVLLAALHVFLVKVVTD